MSVWPGFPSLVGHLLLHFIQSSARCVTIQEYRWSPFLRWNETEDPIHSTWNTPAAVLNIHIVVKQWMAAQLLPWGCILKNNWGRQLDLLCPFLKILTSGKLVFFYLSFTLWWLSLRDIGLHKTSKNPVFCFLSHKLFWVWGFELSKCRRCRCAEDMFCNLSGFERKSSE